MHRSVKFLKVRSELLSHQIEAKQINSELQELKYKNEVEDKNKQLATMSLQLVVQKDVFQSLSEKIEKLYHEKSIDEEAFRMMNFIIEDSADNEISWNQFKTLFEKVHVNFFTTLKSKCPSLTENELRLCAYLKINLQAKEIARMLNVSPSTIFTNRHHIRRKLCLEKDASLEDYLRKI